MGFDPKKCYDVDVMKLQKLLLLPALCLLLFPTPILAAGASPTTAPANTPQINEQSLLSTLSEVQSQKQILLAAQIELRQLEEKGPPTGEEVEALASELTSLEEKLVTLKQTEEPDLNAIAALEEQVAAQQFELEQATQVFQERVELHRQSILQLKDKIANTEAEIDKLIELAKTQAMDFLLRIGLFLVFLVILLALRHISGKMIRRYSGKMPLQRERALVRINKIIFDILITVSIIVALFSQVLSFLPFVAILGTALAFAMRDIISSFIAWFIIGTEQGYKIGDLIQTGDLRGRVLEVHPLLTVVRQTGLRGDTGRIVSFPNKYIFEQEVQNFSKMYRFIYIMVNFILDRDSDIDAAKELLKSTILEATKHDHEEAKKNLPNLQSRFSLTANHIEPQIFIEPDPRGILLRGKYFCRLENRHKSRSDITELFFRRVQKADNVNLRFVEFGDDGQDKLMIDTVNF